MTDGFRCGKCHVSIPVAAWNQPAAVLCGGCGSGVQALVFPAIHVERRGLDAQAILEAGEASCFYHPESRAHVVCDECGRFICGLCDLDLDGRHSCPPCLNARLSRTTSTSGLETKRVMYDSIALALAVLPSFLLSPTLLSAPATLFLSIWWWRRPTSVLPRTKIRFVIALLIAISQIGFWGWIFFQMAFGGAKSDP